MRKSVLIALASLVVGCKSGSPAKPADAAASDNPHDTDSLYALVQHEMHDADPHAAASGYICESERLAQQLGVETSQRRIRAMLDTVYATKEAQRLHEAFENKVGNTLINDDGCPTFRYEPPDSTKYYDSLRHAKKP